MKFIPVKTRAIVPPKDNIYQVLDSFLPPLKEGDVVFITSKVLAIHQGRCIPKDQVKSKEKFVLNEAELYVPRKTPNGNFFLTIKEHTLIPSSGIDESNGKGHYVLWPKKISLLLKRISQYLKKKHRIKKLALVATDSHTTPLRRGVTGISIGFYGLEPVLDLRGKPDIFGRKLKFTRVNVVDAISAMAVLLMGESKERTPIVILRGARFIRFTKKNTSKKITIPLRHDLYRPLLKLFKKRRENL